MREAAFDFECSPWHSKRSDPFASWRTEVPVEVEEVDFRAFGRICFTSLGRNWNHVLARCEQPDGRCPQVWGLSINVGRPRRLMQ